MGAAKTGFDVRVNIASDHLQNEGLLCLERLYFSSRSKPEEDLSNDHCYFIPLSLWCV